MEKYGFDGLDIDYEFPAASDKKNYGIFVKELSQALKPKGYEVILKIF